MLDLEAALFLSVLLTCVHVLNLKVLHYGLDLDVLNLDMPNWACSTCRNLLTKGFTKLMVVEISYNSYISNVLYAKGSLGMWDSWHFFCQICDYLLTRTGNKHYNIHSNKLYELGFYVEDNPVWREFCGQDDSVE